MSTARRNQNETYEDLKNEMQIERCLKNRTIKATCGYRVDETYGLVVPLAFHLHAIAHELTCESLIHHAEVLVH